MPTFHEYAAVISGPEGDVLATTPIATEASLITRATEVTLVAATGFLSSIDTNIDVALSTRAAASQLPAALVGGRLDVNTGAWLGSTAPTVGQKVMASSLPVVIASDQTRIPVLIDAKQVTIHAGAVGAAGSTVVQTIGQTTFVLVVNMLTVAPNTITYTLQCVDPNDLTTVYGTTATTGAINTNGVDTLALPIFGLSDSSGVGGCAVRVSWTVTGAGVTDVRTTAFCRTDRVIVSGLTADGGLVSSAPNPVLVAGQDGSNVQTLRTNTLGNLAIIGMEATGINPAATNNPVLIGYVHVGGGGIQPPRIFEIDTGAGTEYVAGANLRISASGGSIEAKGQQLMASSLPVTIASNQSTLNTTDVSAGTLNNGAQVTVDNTAGGVQILAADATRKAAIVQNTGTNNIRVGASGITNTTGFRLTAGATATFSAPYPVTSAIFAIREGASNSTALGQGIT